MKILLVGDSGTTGSAVADLLASRGHTVRNGRSISPMQRRSTTCTPRLAASTPWPAPAVTWSMARCRSCPTTSTAPACATRHWVRSSWCAAVWRRLVRGIFHLDQWRDVGPACRYGVVGRGRQRGGRGGSPGRLRSNSPRFASTSSTRHFSRSRSPRSGTCFLVRHPCRQRWSPTPTSGRSRLWRLARFTASTRPSE